MLKRFWAKDEELLKNAEDEFLEMSKDEFIEMFLQKCNIVTL